MDKQERGYRQFDPLSSGKKKLPPIAAAQEPPYDGFLFTETVRRDRGINMTRESFDSNSISYVAKSSLHAVKLRTVPETSCEDSLRIASTFRSTDSVQALPHSLHVFLRELNFHCTSVVDQILHSFGTRDWNEICASGSVTAKRCRQVHSPSP